VEIGKIIKENRTAKEMTQEELANEFFVSRPLISKWENGRSYPDLEQLLKLSEFFDLTLDELMRGDKKMTTTIIKKDKRKRYAIWILAIVLVILSIALFKNYSNRVSIEFKKEGELPPSLSAEPFKREEIKEISVKDNLVTITFQSSLESSYYGYFTDGGGGEATINLYKKKIPDDNSLKYNGTTQIDLSSMPKIKKLFVTVQ